MLNLYNESFVDQLLTLLGSVLLFKNFSNGLWSQRMVHSASWWFMFFNWYINGQWFSYKCSIMHWVSENMPEMNVIDLKSSKLFDYNVCMDKGLLSNNIWRCLGISVMLLTLKKDDTTDITYQCCLLHMLIMIIKSGVICKIVHFYTIILCTNSKAVYMCSCMQLVTCAVTAVWIYMCIL